MHTTAPSFDLEIVRDGLEEVVVHSVANLAGVIQDTPPNAYEVGCGWSTVTEVTVGEDWASGTYVASFRMPTS